MTPDEVDRILAIMTRQRPFRAYVIELFSGDRLTVVHPEAVGRWNHFYYFIGRDRTRRFFVAASVCQIFLPAES